VSSFLSPCSFNSSVVSRSVPKTQQYILKNVPSEAAKVKLVTSDGSDAEDNFDLYVDLFSSNSPAKSQGRVFGNGGGLLGIPLGAAGG